MIVAPRKFDKARTQRVIYQGYNFSFADHDALIILKKEFLLIFTIFFVAYNFFNDEVFCIENWNPLTIWEEYFSIADRTNDLN